MYERGERILEELLDGEVILAWEETGSVMHILHKLDKVLSIFQKIQGIDRRRIWRANWEGLEHIGMKMNEWPRNVPSGLSKMKEIGFRFEVFLPRNV